MRLARNRRDVEVIFHAADLAAGQGEEGLKKGRECRAYACMCMCMVGGGQAGGIHALHMVL